MATRGRSYSLLYMSLLGLDLISIISTSLEDLLYLHYLHGSSSSLYQIALAMDIIKCGLLHVTKLRSRVLLLTSCASTDIARAIKYH
jgi:hypothetical protein